MITLADAEIELERAKGRQESLTAQLQALQADCNEGMGLVSSWQTIVNALRKGNLSAAAADTHAATALPAAVADSASEVWIGEPDDEEEEGENKTQFVRDQIKANSVMGVDPKWLKKAAAAAGLAHPPSWPYGPLQRLKKKGEIIKRKGRFYPAPTGEGIALVG